jgi:hypothetical protein
MAKRYGSSAQDIYTYTRSIHTDVISYTYYACIYIVITACRTSFTFIYMKERKIDKEAYS